MNSERLKRFTDKSHPLHYGYQKGGGGAPAPMPSSTTTTQKMELSDEQKKFLVPGLEAAQSKILGQTPEYFPGSTTVPFSPETNLALDLTTQRALAGSPVQNTANQELQNTLSGSYLSGGQGFNQALQAATNKIIPQVNSIFGRSGRYGSGLNQEAMASGIADAFSNQFGSERDRMLKAQLIAPQAAASDYTDISQLGGVGAAREGLAQQQLAEQIARHNFDQTAEAQNIANYVGLTGSLLPFNTTKTGTEMPSYTPNSPYSGSLGGALAGYGMFGPLGGLGGGLAGLFF